MRVSDKTKCANRQKCALADPIRAVPTGEMSNRRMYLAPPNTGNAPDRARSLPAQDELDRNALGNHDMFAETLQLKAHCLQLRKITDPPTERKEKMETTEIDWRRRSRIRRNKSMRKNYDVMISRICIINLFWACENSLNAWVVPKNSCLSRQIPCRSFKIATKDKLIGISKHLIAAS